MVLATCCLAIVLCGARWLLQETVVHISFSPDGKYSLSVLERNLDRILPVMPGQGSDGKCCVELRETASRRTIARKDVAMLQLIERIRWDLTGVWINPRCAISYDGTIVGTW